MQFSFTEYCVSKEKQLGPSLHLQSAYTRVEEQP